MRKYLKQIKVIICIAAITHVPCTYSIFMICCCLSVKSCVLILLVSVSVAIDDVVFGFYIVAFGFRLLRQLLTWRKTKN